MKLTRFICMQLQDLWRVAGGGARRRAGRLIVRTAGARRPLPYPRFPGLGAFSAPVEIQGLFTVAAASRVAVVTAVWESDPMPDPSSAPPGPEDPLAAQPVDAGTIAAWTQTRGNWKCPGALLLRRLEVELCR